MPEIYRCPKCFQKYEPTPERKGAIRDHLERHAAKWNLGSSWVEEQMSIAYPNG